MTTDVPAVAHVSRSQAYAVLMTLYRSDGLPEFEQAVASIEAQDVSDATVRIYLCIDGSLTQEQAAWLEQARPRFYKVVQNPINVGLARSLNVLIDVLEDEDLVFRMDGDDLSAVDRFRKQAEYLSEHAQIDLIGCQAWDIDEQGKVIAERRFATDPAVIAELIYRMDPVLHPTFCMRRRILRNPSLRYPDAYLAEDLGFLITAMKLGYGIGNHPEFLFYWRLGESFFERRSSLRRALAELQWYTKALWLRKGYFTPYYVYPVGRFVLRCVPAGIMRWIYGSGVREWVMTHVRRSQRSGE